MISLKAILVNSVIQLGNLINEKKILSFVNFVIFLNFFGSKEFVANQMIADMLRVNSLKFGYVGLINIELNISKMHRN